MCPLEKVLKPQLSFYLVTFRAELPEICACLHSRPARLGEHLMSCLVSRCFCFLQVLL